MAKPTDLPVAATDANYPAGTDPWSGTPTKVEPVSGEQAAGYLPDQKPPAQYLNWWMNLVYLWILYLSAGAFEGDVSFDGATVYSAVLNVTLTAVKHNWDPTGLGNLTGVRTIRVQGDVQGYNIYGLIAGVDGQEIEIINVGLYELYLVHEHTTGITTVDHRFAFGCFTDTDRFVWLYPNAVVRLRYDGTSQRWRCLGMQGCLIERHILLGGSSAATNDPTTDTVNGGVMFIKSLSPLVYPIILPTGSILESYTVYLNKGSDNTHDLRTTLVSAAVNAGTGGTSETYVTTSANAPGALTLAGAPIVNTANYTIGGESLIQFKDSGTPVQFYVLVSSATGTSVVDLVNAVVLYGFVPFGC